jgi:hypothetical protein
MSKFDADDPKLQNFLKSLVRTAINAGIYSLVRKMGTMWLVIMLALAIGLVIYFKWY